MSKKVILFPSSVEPVGVAVHVLNLSKLLDQANLLELVICPNSGWLTKKLASNGIDYKILPVSPNPNQFVHSNLSLFDTLSNFSGKKILHLHGRFPLLISSLSMLLLPNFEFYVTVHQFINASDQGIMNWKSRSQSFYWRHFIDGICCVSKPLESEVTERVGKNNSSKISTIHNWIEPLHFHGNIDSICYQKSSYNIVGVGRLVEEKGFDILIEAIKILNKDGWNISCDIYGEGPERPNLSNTIIQHDLEESIELLGAHDSVRTLLPNYDLLVIPSRTESFGLVALEAYDAGIPVIASNIPGISEIVHDEETGLLFELGNSQSLADNISKILSSQNIAEKLIQGSQRFVKDYFPGDHILEQYYELYYD